MSDAQAQVHASAVAINGKGCLITGASGSGKSTLCFELMALGADLIADDRVDLEASLDALLLSCPVSLKGLIEARGVGLIQTLSLDQPVACALIVDLDHASERLPTPEKRDLLGIPCPVINGAKRSGLASIVYVLMKQGDLLDPGQGIHP
jgi:HPr kinase/phosphorylase